MLRIGFRARLLIILFSLAVIPLVVATLVFSGALREAIPLLRAGGKTWGEDVAESGRVTLDLARRANPTPAESATVERHETRLEELLQRTRQLSVIGARAPTLVGLFALATLLVLTLPIARIAGHLSRQLSRPLRELVDWTERIARGEPLPDGPPRRGAPEFEMLRVRMRRMARELSVAREQEVEAARLRAFRESARQVAHELKNPLTPIRFAVERIKRDAPPSLSDTIAVLATETERLERMARAFAQFGRLPEGPDADVDVGELVRAAASTTVPPHIAIDLAIPDDVPSIRGHYDPLLRALANALLNAVAACETRGAIAIRVTNAAIDGRPAVRVAVSDTGRGIAAEQLPTIWEPYVTHTAGGTGLGLAIARQTIIAHGGTVAASSTQGEGTVIEFTLPVRGNKTVAAP